MTVDTCVTQFKGYAGAPDRVVTRAARALHSDGCFVRDGHFGDETAQEGYVRAVRLAWGRVA